MARPTDPLLAAQRRQERRQASGVYVSTLRFLFRLVNLVLAGVGLSMLLLAVYWLVLYEDNTRDSGSGSGAGASLPPPALGPVPGPGGAALAGNLKDKAFPWFLVAFGGAGALMCLTALTGFAGVSCNSPALLGAYSTLLVVMLLCQAGVAVASFSDRTWSRYLPPDDTGKARWVARFVRHHVEVCRWVGLAVLAIQVASIALAFALSSAQTRALEIECAPLFNAKEWLVEREEAEDEVWQRQRRPQRRLDSTSSSSAAAAAAERLEAGPGPPRTDAWSLRMRDKYGLDTAQFGYRPLGGSSPQGGPAGPPGGSSGEAGLPPESGGEGQQRRRRCSIM